METATTTKTTTTTGAAAAVVEEEGFAGATAVAPRDGGGGGGGDVAPASAALTEGGGNENEQTRDANAKQIEKNAKKKKKKNGEGEREKTKDENGTMVERKESEVLKQKRSEDDASNNKHHLWLGRRMKIERGTGTAGNSYKRPMIACIVFHDPSESHPFHVTFEDGTNAWVRIQCTSLPTLNMNGQNTANASAPVADGEIFIRNEDYKANTRLGSHGKGNGKESGEKSFEWLGDKSTLGIAINNNVGVNKHAAANNNTNTVMNKSGQRYNNNSQEQQYQRRQQQLRLQQQQQQQMRGTNANSSLGRQQQQRKPKRGMQEYGNNNNTNSNRRGNGNGHQGGYFNDGGMYGNDNSYIGFGGMRVNDNWNPNTSNNANSYNFQFQQYQQQMQHLQMQQQQLQMRYNNVANNNNNSNGKKNKKKSAKKGSNNNNVMNDLYGGSGMMSLSPLQLPPNASQQQRYSMLQHQMQQHVFQQQQQMQRQQQMQIQRQQQQHQQQQHRQHQQQSAQQRSSYHKNTGGGGGGTSSPRAKNNNGVLPTRGSTRMNNDTTETLAPSQPARPLAATLFEQHEIARCTVCGKVCKSHPGFVAHVKKHAEEHPAKVRAMLAASKKYRSKQPHRSAEYIEKRNAANNNNITNNSGNVKAGATTTTRATRAQSPHPQVNEFGMSGYEPYISDEEVPTVTTGRARRQGAGQKIESDYVYAGNMEKMRRAREGRGARGMSQEPSMQQQRQHASMPPYVPNNSENNKKRPFVNVPRTCQKCGRVCASAVGHASHVRACKKTRRS